jgi:hypothetical protein
MDCSTVSKKFWDQTVLRSGLIFPDRTVASLGEIHLESPGQSLSQTHHPEPLIEHFRVSDSGHGDFAKIDHPGSLCEIDCSASHVTRHRGPTNTATHASLENLIRQRMETFAENFIKHLDEDFD